VTHTTKTHTVHLRFLSIFTASAAAVFALSAGAFAAPPARSESSIFFDWGSNEKVNDSGREVVSFDKKVRTGELIVSFGDRRVYFITSPGQALSYPIAIPREKSKWAGVTSVSEKRVNPSWTPTPDMIAENPRLPPWVPGGHPMNPLGTHALYLGSSSYRIHGTDAPWTIGTAASKGCVRMYNKDVQDLYPRVPIGTRVTVTYDTYKFEPLDSASANGVLAVLDKGRKTKSEDDVAGAAADNAKKWRGDDAGEDATVHKASASAASDSQDKKSSEKPNVDGDKVAVVKSGREGADGSGSGRDSENSETSSKSADAAADVAGDAGLFKDRKKRIADKLAVETGSVDKSEDKSDARAKRASDAEEQKPKEPKDKVAAREKPQFSQEKKSVTNDDDSAAVAKRALAAAERAAAAAERAADAAERASEAVVKAMASSESKAAERKSIETEPMKEWPVVR
jgi:lipoprotein-anchoring transpeptidase ErfK/SrfK